MNRLHQGWWWLCVLVVAQNEDSTKYLLYRSHSGLGNQLTAMKHAMALAVLSNRTLVVPPPLQHYDMARYSHHCHDECALELALKSVPKSNLNFDTPRLNFLFG